MFKCLGDDNIVAYHDQTYILELNHYTCNVQWIVLTFAEAEINACWYPRVAVTEVS